MVTALLALCLQATPLELMSPERVRLLPVDERSAHLRALDSELFDLRREPTLDVVFAQAGQKMTPFVVWTGVPLLALTGLAALGATRLPAKLWIGAGSVLGVGLFAALVYCVGSVVEHLLVTLPARRERAARLEAYRRELRAGL